MGGSHVTRERTGNTKAGGGREHLTEKSQTPARRELRKVNQRPINPPIRVTDDKTFLNLPFANNA